MLHGPAIPARTLAPWQQAFRQLLPVPQMPAPLLSLDLLGRNQSPKLLRHCGNWMSSGGVVYVWLGQSGDEV